MKEELVSLAKEKGFMAILLRPIPYKEGTRWYSLESIRYYVWMCELQKWLRKKHNIDISIIPNYAHYKNGGLTGQKTYRLGIYYTENGLIDCFFIRPPDDKDLFIEYNIYEEALEEGLKQGLNLIK